MRLLTARVGREVVYLTVLLELLVLVGLAI